MTAGFAAAGTTAALHPAPHPGPGPGSVGVPWSPCGPDCLNTPAPARRLRRVLRSAALLGLLLLLPGLLLLVLVPGLLLRPARRFGTSGTPGRDIRYPGAGDPVRRPGRRHRPRRAWLAAVAGAVLRTAGVTVRVHGTVPPGAALVVANHRSWIDVLALTAVTRARLLAKHEVRTWPLVGVVAAAGGALFVDRARLHALPGTVGAMATALRAGDRVGVFPEGTTWCGAAAGPLRRAAFQAAVDAGVPVLPVAITIRTASGHPAPDAGFLGAETLADCLARILAGPPLVCEVTVAAPLAPGPDRRALAAAAGAAIGAASGVPHPVGRPAPQRTRPLGAPVRQPPAG